MTDTERISYCTHRSQEKAWHATGSYTQDVRYRLIHLYMKSTDWEETQMYIAKYSRTLESPSVWFSDD
jgi:hypothetical protein